MQRHCAILALLSFSLALPQNANSQSVQERIHDLFITAGYSTAIGACAGAAVAGLRDESTSTFRLVAAGASIGFVGGSLFGSYVVFSPLFVENHHEENINSWIGGVDPEISKTNQVFLSPHIDITSQRMSSITGRYTIWTF